MPSASGRILLLYLVAILLRVPILVVHPRLWAEEGTLYLAAALSEPWWRALLSPRGGYLALVSNAVTLVAGRLLPLEMAPVMTETAALAVQMLPAVVLLRQARSAGPLRPDVLLALAALLLAVPSQEMWLTTTNVQLHFCVATGLILAFPAVAGSVFERGVLGMSALNGLASVVLIPLFWLRVLLGDNRERRLQAVTLTAFGVIQLLALLFAMRAGVRGLAFQPALILAALLVKDVLLPLMGAPAADALAGPIRAWAVRAPQPGWSLLALALVVAAVTAWIVRRRDRPAPWLVGAAILSAIIGVIGAVGRPPDLVTALGAGRYFFAANTFLLLALVYALAPGVGHPIARRARATLLACALGVGLYEFVRPAPWFFTGPRWSDEIEQWRKDPDRPVAVWPVPLQAHLVSRGPRPTSSPSPPRDATSRPAP